MKRISYLILLMILFIPIYVKADGASLQVNCTPTEVKAGDTISCLIKGTTADSVGSLKMILELGSGLSVDNFTRANQWDYGAISNNKISATDDDQYDGTFDIGTLTIKVNDNATDGQALISFTQIVFNDDIDNTSENVPDKEVKITISNSTTPTPTPTATGLKSLTVNGGVLAPQFSSKTTGYMITLDGSRTTFSLSAVAENGSDAITYTNADTNETLDPSNIAFTTSGGNDAMAINIKVGSGDNLVTYFIAVQKEVSTEDKTNELSSLKVGDQTVSLVSGKYDYSVTLSDVSSYEIVVDLKDRTNYEASFVTPRAGEGSFTIIVKPKDNSSGLKSQTYTINVTKSGSSSTTPTPTPSSSVKPSTPSENPKTGGVVSVLMALILVAAFGASIYYYKKNMGYFNK